MFTKTSTFLRDHLAPINTLVVPFTLLNGFLDFLGGAFLSVKYVVFTLIGMSFVGMTWLAIKENGKPPKPMDLPNERLLAGIVHSLGYLPPCSALLRCSAVFLWPMQARGESWPMLILP